MPYAAPSAKPRHHNWKRQDRATYDLYRGSAAERGYDATWRKVRLQKLSEYPLCEDCLNEGKYTPALDVHHIKKLSEHPELRDEPTNLRSLCRKCHNLYTSQGL